MFQVIVAMDANRGIGYKGSIPWNLNEDMRHFVQKTCSSPYNMVNVVIMGYKTWLSLKKKALPNRINVIVLTPNTPAWDALTKNENIYCVASLDDALQWVKENRKLLAINDCWVIGGKKLFVEALQHSECRSLWITQIDSTFECDVHFPYFTTQNWQLDFLKTSSIQKDIQTGIEFQFSHYIKQHEEYQYLNLVKEVIADGLLKDDRTKVGTLSVFGRQMRFSLRNGKFPLLTTKRVFWKGVVLELLWFLRGQTDATILSKEGVNIWNDNSSLKFLQERGLHTYEEGDVGPMYGFAWRHWGTEYQGASKDYSGKGIDQIAQIIDTIKRDPHNRRLVLSAWNVSDLDKMALNPCHVMCQFYVANGELSCQMYQRSADLGLGVPFNIASYALLTCLLAKTCELKPGEFVHTLGDAHVYNTHVEPLRKQLQREPREFPVLQITKALSTVQDLEQLTLEDFILENYTPHEGIKMKMAV